MRRRKTTRTKSSDTTGLMGKTRGLISRSTITNGKRKAKKIYVVLSDGVKDHPFKSLGFLTLGMGILSSLYLWQRFHHHTHR